MTSQSLICITELSFPLEATMMSVFILSIGEQVDDNVNQHTQTRHIQPPGGKSSGAFW